MHNKGATMTKGKEQFIGHVSSCLGRAYVPKTPTPLHLPHTVQHDFLQGADGDELERIFIANAKLSNTTIYQCEMENINKSIAQAIHDFGSGRTLIADHSFFNEHDTSEVLSSHCKEIRKWDLNDSRENNIAYAEQASIGITIAELALAESGTVLLFSHGGSGRSVSLLPEYTITVVRKEDIRPRLTQGMSFLREQIETGLPSSINFISGASSTADIELVRVQGVHGPLATAYIIVN
jgi:L-lactate dehydrogenase complex protein LldG